MIFSGFTNLAPNLAKLQGDEYSPMPLAENSARVRMARFSITPDAAGRMEGAFLALAVLKSPRIDFLSIVVRLTSTATTGSIILGLTDTRTDTSFTTITASPLATIDGSKTEQVFPIVPSVEDLGPNRPVVLMAIVDLALPAGTVITGHILYAAES